MPQIVLRDSVAASSGLSLASNTALVLLDDGSGRLLSLNGSFYALSPSATLLLHTSLVKGVTEAASMLAERYSVPLSTIQRDLEELLTQLTQRKLVQPIHDIPVLPRANIVLLWALHCVCWVFRTPRSRASSLLALAFVAIRRLGWVSTIATWQDYLCRQSPIPLANSVRAVGAAVNRAAAWHPLPVSCKERSLVCWLLLRTAGVPARLVVGIDCYPFASHCWCAQGEDVVADFPDRCQRYHPVFVYD